MATHRTIIGLGVFGAIFAGHTLPVQGRINSEMSLRLGDSLLASLISFSGSLLIVIVASLFTSHGRSSWVGLLKLSRDGTIPWWFHSGGIIGAIFVVTMTIAVPVLGLAVYTVMVVAGQTASGLAVDRAGWGPGGKRRITPLRLIGVVFTISGVAWAVSPRFSNLPELEGAAYPMLLVLIAGMLMSVQHAFNGTIAVAVASPLPGTLANYALGVLILLLAWSVKFILVADRPQFPTDPWLYLAGLLGVANLLMSAVLIRYIGILLTGLGMVAGQLLGSLWLDWILPVAGSEINLHSVFGTIAVLIAIGVTALTPSGPSPPPKRD